MPAVYIYIGFFFAEEENMLNELCFAGIHALLKSHGSMKWMHQADRAEILSQSA